MNSFWASPPTTEPIYKHVQFYTIWSQQAAYISFSNKIPTTHTFMLLSGTEIIVSAKHATMSHSSVFEHGISLYEDASPPVSD